MKTNISIISNKQGKVPVSISTFPAGETLVKIEDIESVLNNSILTINWNYVDDSDVMAICQIVDILRNHDEYVSIILNVPYLPNSRMDRATDKSMSFSLRVFANIINSLNFESVYTDDVHSDVSNELIDNLTNNEQQECFAKTLLREGIFIKRNEVLVSPDKGAYDKRLPLLEIFGFDKSIVGNKVRDPATGNIVKTEICRMSGNVNSFSTISEFWIVDDICDGGRTFIELAKVLKETYPNTAINLYTTHGIYSKGIEVLEEHFKRVLCLNDMRKLITTKNGDKND